MALKINRKLQLISRILGWAVVIILVGAVIKLLIWEENYYVSKSAEKRNDPTPVLTKINIPLNIDDTKNDPDQHQVEKDKPRTIRIERLGIYARVTQSKNVESNNMLPISDNIYDAMWYQGSSRLGKGGTIIISGLSNTDKGAGIFSKLDSLENGDKIELDTSSSDEKFIYEVKEIKMIASKNTNELLPTAQQRIDGKETLSLITAQNIDSDSYSTIVLIKAVKTE